MSIGSWMDRTPRGRCADRGPRKAISVRLRRSKLWPPGAPRGCSMAPQALSCRRRRGGEPNRRSSRCAHPGPHAGGDVVGPEVVRISAIALIVLGPPSIHPETSVGGTPGLWLSDATRRIRFGRNAFAAVDRGKGHTVDELGAAAHLSPLVFQRVIFPEGVQGSQDLVRIQTHSADEPQVSVTAGES